MKNPMLALLCLFLFRLPAARAEVVVVDFQKVFEEYKELKEVDQEFRQTVVDFQETQRPEIEALQAKREQFNQLRARAAQADVTDEERQELAAQATTLLEELQQGEQKLQTERNQFQQELEAKGNRLRRRMVDQVTAKIEVLAKARGWTLVVDGSARGVNGLPVVQYASTERDMTALVISELNAAQTPAGTEE